MTPDWIVYVCMVLGLTSALVAGVFGAFSSFIMRGLLQATTAAGIGAMQQINITVLHSSFLYAFFVLVPASIGLAIFASIYGAGTATLPIVAAATIYVVTVLIVTIFGNVPMNERLSKLDSATVDATEYWLVYGKVWTRWNHLRTLGCCATAACYLLVPLLA